MSANNNLPTIGFIGTGTISTALVSGLCGREGALPYPIYVSPQYEKNALALKKAFPQRVTVAQSLQEVADNSDWLVLAVLPEAGEEVCRSIRFRPQHKVINLLTDKTLPQIRSWIGETAVLVHMVPLTFNAFVDGPIVLCPPQPEAAAIFGQIGVMIEVEERYHAAVLAAVTGCGASFFTLLDTMTEWTKSMGVPENLAASYVCSFFHAICEQALRVDAERLHELAFEATPGGLNHMVKQALTEQGGFQMWAEAMEPLMRRLTANF